MHVGTRLKQSRVVHRPQIRAMGRVVSVWERTAGILTRRQGQALLAWVERGRREADRPLR